MTGMTLIHYGKRQLDFVLTGGLPHGYLLDKSTGRVVALVSNGNAVVQGRVQPLWQLLGYHSPHEFNKADQMYLVRQFYRGLKSCQ
jgi:predicted Zn-dependent protease